MDFGDNPISVKIEEDFDISKDAKFSIRTLMLLSVFAIGCFFFGISPKLFGYDLNSNFRIFAAFVGFVISGQGAITWFHYNLNRNKIKKKMSDLQGKIKYLQDDCDEAQKKTNYWQQRYDEIKSKPFPQCMGHTTIKDLAELDREWGDNTSRYKRKFLDLENKLRNAKNIKRDYEALYSWINGRIVFWLASAAVALSLFSVCSGKSVVDYIAEYKPQSEIVEIDKSVK